jgi:dihydrofolate synthase/folylpolyglutamate synthase
VRLALAGRHQADNALVAARLLEAIDEGGMRVPTAAITTGLTDTRWPGRLQLVRRPERPLLVVDGAHTAAGAAALAAFLEEAALTPATLVIGVMRDKDREALLPPLLACASRVVTTTLLPPRGLEADVLAAEIRAMAPHLPVTAAHSPEDALTMADASGSTVVVAGSLFLAGAVLALSSSSTESAEPADPA